jgi:hypothetical protein
VLPEGLDGMADRGGRLDGDSWVMLDDEFECALDSRGGGWLAASDDGGGWDGTQGSNTASG